jgi:DNA helicase II / ATP-dependent DNA helicase PcrA
VIAAPPLDPEQQAIADASGQNTLVLAGPGTGKTTLLTGVAAIQVRTSEPSNARVLCLTFGVEAAHEMDRRLRRREMGIRRPHRLHVANFHQFGFGLLHAYGDRIGLVRTSDVIGKLEAVDLIAEMLPELKLGHLQAMDVYSDIEKVRNNRHDDVTTVRAETLRRILDEYKRRKLDYGLLDYNDLILRAADLLRSDERVRRIVQKMYRHVVVDEMQDTSANQLELLGLVSDWGRTPVFAVADNDQMIYSWRDARPQTLSDFQSEFAAVRKELLGNYRCPPNVVAAANCVVTRAGAAGTPYSRIEDRRGQLLVARLVWSVDESRSVAEIIANEVRLGVAPEEIAVLAPVWYVFAPIQVALAARSVPSALVGRDDEAGQPFVRIMRATLTVQVRPKDAQARRSLARLVSENDDIEEAETRRSVERLIAASNPLECLRISAEIAGLGTDDPVVTHAQQIVRLAQREAGASQSDELLGRLRIEWTRLAAKVRRDERSVKLMTTFGAKGLQFHTIVLPFFDTKYAPWRAHGQQDTPEWQAEERRKLYVAITRSRCRVIFVHKSPPSEYLAEFTNGLLQDWSPHLLHEANHPLPNKEVLLT